MNMNQPSTLVCCSCHSDRFHNVMARKHKVNNPAETKKTGGNDQYVLVLPGADWYIPTKPVAAYKVPKTTVTVIDAVIRLEVCTRRQGGSVWAGT